jgi:signal transduction histidine kinase
LPAHRQEGRAVLGSFNWSIRSTLLAITASVLALILGLGGLSFARLAMVNTTASAVRDLWLPATRDLAEVARLTEHYRMIEGIYLLVDNDADHAVEEMLLAHALADRDVAWAAYERSVLPAERIDNRWRVFYADSAHVLALIKAGQRDAAVALYMDAKGSFIDLRLATADGVAFNARAASDASDQSAAAYTSTRLWIGASLLLGLLFCGASGCVAIFGVSRPILQMAQTMKRIAARDLSAEIVGVGRHGEIGEMADALKIFKTNAIQLHAVHAELEAAKEAAEEANRATQTANATLELRIDERTRELHAAQDELLKKERLSIIGQITATVAHELRNPLSAIRNSAFAMRQFATAGGPPIERPVARIERSVNRCERIVAELLDYTRARDLRCEVRRLDEWLGELAAELAPPPGGAIALELGAADIEVKLDTDRFRRVVINLVENAVQAMAEVKEGAAPPRLVLRTRSLERAVELEIEDNGPGIAPDTLAKVFEPLFSTKSFGTGLGLPTVKQIVEQHEGSIVLMSTVGEGTRAVIRLPRERKSIAA